MQDLHNAIHALKNILNEAPPRGRQDGPGTRQGTTPKPKPAGPAAYNSVGDMMKAIATPGRQGVSDPNQSAKNIAAAQPKPAPAAPKPKPAAFTGRPDDAQKPAAAPKINPAVPAAGPVRANPIDPQAMAATKAAASVVNAPKPAAPAPRAKVKATAANTKDFDKTVALQKKLGVTADGIMGPETRRAMAAAKAKASPAPTGTPRKVSTVEPGLDSDKPKDFTPIAGAGDRRGGRKLRRDSGGSSSGNILDRIGAGISNIFKASPRSARGRRPNAAGSNFATAADGTISRTDNPRQHNDAAPITRTVRQRVTDPNEKAALINKVNKARDLRRLQMAAGSTDPDDIRAYQRRMANTRGTGAAGGTDPNTF